MVGVGGMTEPNTMGWDTTKWIHETSNTKRITLFRTLNGSSGMDGNKSLHVADNLSLTGIDYVVPVGKVFDLLYGEFSQPDQTTTDFPLGIQGNQVADTITTGTLLWCMKLDMSNEGFQQWNFGGGLHFVAGDYVTPYEFNGATSNYKWCFWGWGVESDA